MFPTAGGNALFRHALSSARLDAFATQAMGARNWLLLYRYGRITAGLYSGHCVSALPHRHATRLLRALTSGDVVALHLMHQHVSGKSEISCLRLLDASLWMLYDERCEMA